MLFISIVQVTWQCLLYAFIGVYDCDHGNEEPVFVTANLTKLFCAYRQDSDSSLPIITHRNKSWKRSTLMDFQTILQEW